MSTTTPDELEAALELELRVRQAADRLAAVAFRQAATLTYEEAAIELTGAIAHVFGEAELGPALAVAAERVLERARLNAGPTGRGLIPGLEPPGGLPGGSGPDPLYDPGEHGC